MPLNTEKLAASILDLDLRDINRALGSLWDAGIRSIHIDVIDSSFTDNISFGIGTVNAVLEQTQFAFFIHMMVRNPIPIIRRLKYPEDTRIAVHSHFEELLELEGCIPVLALNPGEDVSAHKMISKFKEVLVMTVEPGFGGQQLMDGCVGKIGECKARGLRVTVDGGVNKDNILSVREADSIVVGSALTKASDMASAVSTLAELIC